MQHAVNQVEFIQLNTPHSACFGGGVIEKLKLSYFSLGIRIRRCGHGNPTDRRNVVGRRCSCHRGKSIRN